MDIVHLLRIIAMGISIDVIGISIAALIVSILAFKAQNHNKE